MFTTSHLFTIMNRKVRIPFVKDYLSKYGKYPTQRCSSVIKQFILGQPHPDHFEYDGGGGVPVGNMGGSDSMIDFNGPIINNPNRNIPTTITTLTAGATVTAPSSPPPPPPRFSFLTIAASGTGNSTSNSNMINCGEIISFNTLTSIIIKKFKPDYVVKKHDTFAMKHLSSFNQFTILAQIDSYFVTYRSLNPVSVKSIIIRSQNHSLVNVNNTSSFSRNMESSNRSSSTTGTDPNTPVQSQVRQLQRPNSILRRSNRLSVTHYNPNNTSLMSINGDTTGRKLTATPIFLGHGRHLSVNSKQLMKFNQGTLNVNASLKLKRPPSIPEKNEPADMKEEEEDEEDNVNHNSLHSEFDLNDERTDMNV